jgi:hypothetical protein
MIGELKHATIVTFDYLASSDTWCRQRPSLASRAPALRPGVVFFPAERPSSESFFERPGESARTTTPTRGPSSSSCAPTIPPNYHSWTETPRGCRRCASLNRGFLTGGLLRGQNLRIPHLPLDHLPGYPSRLFQSPTRNNTMRILSQGNQSPNRAYNVPL